MSAERFVLIVTVALAATTLTLARTIRSMNLDMAVNNTVCPIAVEMDENPDRVPRRIKVLKCAPKPNRWCESLHNIGDTERLQWCQHSIECVDIRDTVVVYYNSKAKWDTYIVSVGCACIKKNSTKISEIKSSGPA